MRPRTALAAAGLAVLGAALVRVQSDAPLSLASGAVVGVALLAPPRVAWPIATAILLAQADAALGLLVPIHAFLAGRRETRIVGVVAAVALIGGLELGTLRDDDSWVPALIIPASAWLTGRALREREVIAEQLAERARELEEERDAHAALSVRYERARIASELHDIVAHAISVMVIQAAAGQRLALRDPEGTTEAFGAIEEAARQAEADMGRLVALLGDEEAIAPAPDLALVEELIARAAGSGLDVSLRLEGQRDGLPAPIAQLAYSVVQEGLTNALRYAAGAPVVVTVGGDTQTLVVEVRNGTAPAEAALAGVGTGTGIQGLRERLSACGGRLEAGPETGGGWVLRARLPRRALVAT
jgi:signal transduction histidine kinase